MAEQPTYRVTEIVGTSDESIHQAVRNGVAKAAETIRHLEWFEITQVRGTIHDGDVGVFHETYRVAPGDTIRIERVSGDVGEAVTFGSVLAVHTEDKKVLSGSHASKAKVTGKIVQQGRSKKVTVLKFKKTNQYKISRGHRQNYTAVQVGEITL